MATMKAVCIHSFGGPEVLSLEKMPVPEPGAEEFLVKVHAAGVNPVDYKIRSGMYPAVKQEQLPVIVGREVAGTVDHCGSSVGGPRPGDPVYAMLGPDRGG